MTSGCATWALASSSRSITWSTAYAGNNFLPHNPPLLPSSVRRLIHSLKRGQVHLNWLMALVIHVWVWLASQRDHHAHQGAQVGASQVAVVQAACLSSSCCQAYFWRPGTFHQFAVLERLFWAGTDEHSVHLHCMYLFKRHKYLLFINSENCCIAASFLWAIKVYNIYSR